MKCQKCDKLATQHIVILTGPEPQQLHFCAEHAAEYLMGHSTQGTPAGGLVSALANGLPKKMLREKAAEELLELDQQTCPICGISFHEFRSRGYFGCPHDYDFFGKQVDAFILNFHGANEHTGKVSIRSADNAQKRMLLIKYRRDLDDAIQYEDYERASTLRDRIREIQ